MKALRHYFFLRRIFFWFTKTSNFQINLKLKSVRNISETFCDIVSYNSQNDGRFALAQRGGCEFLTKALFAQSAGYDGIIILDNQEDTPFTRIIYERTNNRAFFVRIPVIFLLQNEVEAIEKLPLGSYSATLQNDKRDKFFPIWTKSLDKIKKNLLLQFLPLSVHLICSNYDCYPWEENTYNSIQWWCGDCHRNFK